MSKITVVITTYNLEKQIGICLKELNQQTFQEFNIVIIDDCSTDNTVKIAEQYINIFKGNLVIKKLSHNLGSPAKVRNVALDSNLIIGEYVIFLDGDDNIERDFLSKLYEKAIQTNADVVICAYDRIEEHSGKVLCQEMMNFPDEMILPTVDDSLCFINGAIWNKLFKTQIIKDVRIPDFKVGEDLCFQLLVYNKCKKLVSIKDVLIHYNVRKSSVISNTEQSTIIQFADELLHQFQTSQESFKEIIALIAFVHIGISMPIRAYDNEQINISSHLKWTREYFKKNFNSFKGYKCMRLSSLSKHGIRGWAIWVCSILYKLSAFNVFLYIYRVFTKLFHMDFKF